MDRFELGHGAAEVRATLEYNKYPNEAPGAQWSLSIYRALSSVPEPDIARGGGPDADADGYAAVWDIRDVDDQLQVFSPLWTSRGTRDRLPDVVASSPPQSLLPLRWVIRPDDPDTPSDEYSVELFSVEALGAVYSCGGSECPVRFEPGDALIAYFGGAIVEYDLTRNDGFQVLDFWNMDAPGRSDVLTRAVCPE
ncbi:MAG: hypothetical protein AB8I08_34740 [Sandaracinaceae bacterium]